MSVVVDGERLEIAISGMTCAACASRVERKLNRLDGVSAAVNFATESATVSYDPRLAAPKDVMSAVATLGYGAALPVPAAGSGRVRGDDDVGADRVAARRFAICAVLSAPVLLMAMVAQLQFSGWQWLSLLLATPVAFWGAWPFYRAAYRNAKHGVATMDTLVSVGIAAAWLWSVHALVFGDAATSAMRMGMPGMSMGTRGMRMAMSGMRMGTGLIPARGAGANSIYLEVAAVTTTLVLLGRWLQSRARERAGGALRALLDLGAKQATIIDDAGCERTVAIDQLELGQRFIVRPGERIATDGVVEEGVSTVDTSMLTGESVPAEVGCGAVVIGATVNLGGRLAVRATRVGADTMLAQISRLVAEALASKAPVQRLADRVSAVFVPVVFALAAVSFVGWQLAGEETGFAAMTAIAVLVAACPCALGLATPISLLVGAGRGAQLGLLIKGPEILEAAHRVDTVIFDKTGTLTTGQMTLVGVTVDNDADTREAVHLVGALERESRHPVARAIATAAEASADRHRAAVVRRFVSHAGLGVEGEIDGRKVVAGRPELLDDRGMTMTPRLEAATRAGERDGRTVVGAGWDGAARAVFVVADTVKPSAQQAISELRAMGLRIALLSGDNESATRTVARQLGIDEVIAGVLPAQKAATVRRLRDAGRRLAMVGDGINDAPALAAADLGLAIGTGADVAIQASDLTIVSGDPRAAADAIRLSRATLRTIRQNLGLSFAYNLAVLPLAALGFLDPMLAGAAMALSSASVIANALRLTRFRSSR